MKIVIQLTTAEIRDALLRYISDYVESPDSIDEVEVKVFPAGDGEVSFYGN